MRVVGIETNVFMSDLIGQDAARLRWLYGFLLETQKGDCNHEPRLDEVECAFVVVQIKAQRHGIINLFQGVATQRCTATNVQSTP